MSYFLENGRVTDGTNIPKLSTALDSVRSYQWEITFHNLPEGIEVGDAKPLTLAAKQVSQSGFATEDIEVRRGNDKLFFPGYANMDELAIMFDNQYLTKMGKSLYNLMQKTYNPLTGEFTENQAFNEAPTHKTVVDVTQLDGQGNVVSNTRYIGAFCKSWKMAEFNYSTNEFHTVECIFRYDFIAQTDSIPT